MPAERKLFWVANATHNYEMQGKESKKVKKLWREDTLNEFVHNFRLFCRNKAQDLLEIL